MKKIIFWQFIIILAVIFIFALINSQNNFIVNVNFKGVLKITKPVKETRVFVTPDAFRYADEFYIFDYKEADNEKIISQLDNDDLKHLENQIIVCKNNYNSEFYNLFEENFPKEINDNLYYKIKMKRASNLIIVYDSSSSKLYYIGCYFKSNRYPINNGV